MKKIRSEYLKTREITVNQQHYGYSNSKFNKNTNQKTVGNTNLEIDFAAKRYILESMNHKCSLI